MPEIQIGIKQKLEPVINRLSERKNAFEKVDEFFEKLVSSGCSKEDVLNFLEAKGISNAPFIKRAQVLDDRAVIASPVPGELFPATVFRDLHNKQTVAVKRNGVTAHLVDDNKCIITKDVSPNGELGYKTEYENGQLTRLSTAYPSYELTLDANGNFVEKTSIIQEQIANNTSKTAELNTEVKAYNDELRKKQHEFHEKMMKDFRELLSGDYKKHK